MTFFSISAISSVLSASVRAKRTTDTVEQTVTLLKGEDGVLERGRVRALHDGLDILAILSDGSLKGRQIVGVLNLIEVGGTKGQLALHEQRVLMLSLLASCKGHHHSRCHT